MCSTLKQKGHNVECSNDAGDYLCNYTLYQSLKKCENLCNSIKVSDGEPGSCPMAASNIETFFCHVPAFTAISEDKQQ